jgi:hypothetical protein
MTRPRVTQGKSPFALAPAPLLVAMVLLGNLKLKPYFESGFPYEHD